MLSFPRDFVWGASTSAYQIEGAAMADGRGECIWSRFSHIPGNIKNNDTGDVAADHYHHFKDDIAIMRDLGLDAYRFSISWPRIFPKGIGEINRAGLDFYDRVVDTLLEADIKPFACLYHWDLPQALQNRGGWCNPDIVHWFGEYTDAVARRLGDRVKWWATINEPWVVSLLGYGERRKAPGWGDMAAGYLAAHHVLLAHAMGMRVLRQLVPESYAGIVLDHTYAMPATEADSAAAKIIDGIRNRWFTDPVFFGEYPADIVAHLGATLRDVDLSQASDMALPMDYVGLNYYSRSVAGKAEAVPTTDMGWDIYPQGLRHQLNVLHEVYKAPAIYITENGAAYDDPAPWKERIIDPKREDYLRQHVKAVAEAINDGAPVKGYLLWSLLDNFEWEHGYDKRFGIVHVDYKTQRRIIKDSGLWYKSFIAKARDPQGQATLWEA